MPSNASPSDASAVGASTANAAPVAGASGGRAAPSRLRFALALIPGAYLLITVILYGLGPVLEGWPLFLRSLAIVPLMVFGMVYGVIPLVRRVL